MFMRKINAGLSLIVTFMVLVHAISLAAWMLSMGGVPKLSGVMPWVLTWLTALHALLSIGLNIAAHKGNHAPKGKKYAKINAATFAQRITGALMVVFTVLHIAGASKAMQPPQVVHAIVPPLFFTVVLAHTAISASRALITLGIGNAKTVKVANIVVKVICVTTLIADVTGFYLYVC